MRIKPYEYLMLFVLPLLAVAYTPHETVTEVLVVNENLAPIEGAEVAVTYTPTNGNMPNINGMGISSRDGVYRFRETSWYKASVGVYEEGFYPSHYPSVPTIEYDRKSHRWNPLDPNLEVVLKRKINPIPMYAARGVRLYVEVFNTPVGFDLEKSDWVSPYGIGVESDLIFRLSGEFASYNDFDIKLELTFSKEGDGIIPFSADLREGSLLKSPQVAPLDDYLPTLLWSKKIRPVEGKPYESIRESDLEETDCYLLRVRSVLVRWVPSSGQ